MIGTVVEFADLQRISGYSRAADVERWAKRVGLPVKPSRRGIWTTKDALNTALGIAVSSDNDAATIGAEAL